VFAQEKSYGCNTAPKAKPLQDRQPTRRQLSPCKLKFAHERGFRDMRKNGYSRGIRMQRPHTKRPPGQSAAHHNQLKPPCLVTRQPGPQGAAHVMLRLRRMLSCSRASTQLDGDEQKRPRIGQSRPEGNPILLIITCLGVRKWGAQKPGRRGTWTPSDGSRSTKAPPNVVPSVRLGFSCWVRLRRPCSVASAAPFP
jgi:hypothetical protein